MVETDYRGPVPLPEPPPDDDGYPPPPATVNLDS